MKEYKPKPCVICGQIFTPDRISREVCDNERCLKIFSFNSGISNRYWMKKCAWCHENETSCSARKYCSDECSHNYQKMRSLIKEKFEGDLRKIHLSLLKTLGKDYMKILELVKIAEKNPHSS